MTPEGGELENLRQQLRVVTEVANQLAGRLFALEARLAHLESGGVSVPPVVMRHMGVVPPPLPVAPPPVPEGMEGLGGPLPDGRGSAGDGGVGDAGFAGPGAQGPMGPPPVPRPVGAKIETQVGLTWANRIGVITLIIGVAFAFKYLVDNDYIGAGGRVVIGVLAAALTLFAGDVLWHRSQRVFAQGLTGLGIAILYLSFYAAFGFYHLIPQEAALLLMVVTTTCGGALAMRYNARAIAILTLFGGYATPVMLSSGTPNDVFYASYMVVLNAVGLWVARKQGWRVVQILALIGTLVVEGAWLADRGSFLGRPLLIASTLAQYALFASGPLWIIAAVAHLAAAFAVGAFHWNAITQEVLLVAGLGIFYWRKWAMGPPVVFLGWWIGYAVGMPFWGGYQGRVAVWVFGYCSLAFLILLAYPVVLARVRRGMPGIPVLATMGINGLAYFGTAHELLKAEYGDYMGLLAVAVAVLYLAAGWAIWNFQAGAADGTRDSRTPILAGGMALAFLALAVPIQFTGYRVAIAWAIQAAALGFIASRLPSWKVLIGAAVVAVLAIGDLPVGLEYAAKDYRPLLNPDFVTFAVVAASLWLLTYFVTKTPGVPVWAAGPVYVIGHFVFLTGLHYEVFQYLDWTQHSWNAKLLASTLLLAIYGIILLMIGIQTRTVINRVMGLVLFAIVIFKLYLSDVWMFDVIFKMVAFLALGGLLVAGSYLYSRYRSRIETLWKKDDATA